MVFSEKHSVPKFYRKKITCKMLRINALEREILVKLEEEQIFSMSKKKI